MILKTNYLVIFLAFTFLSCQENKKEKKEDEIAIVHTKQEYIPEKVVDGISIPWGMVWLPDGSMLITEKSGTLYHFKDGKKKKVNNVPKVYHHSQGGLLDIALHPDYEKNGWIYMTYASDEGTEKGGHTALIRCQLQDGALTQIQQLYKGEPNTTAGQHFGSRIAFDDNNFLYFSIGDRFERDKNPQDITRDGGKIYRLHDDGSIPQDNPFYDKPNAKKAVYTYGNRNPQGIVKHPETGEMWMHEHGPKGGDEINIIKKGANYGWPEITYGVNYDGTKITDETTRSDMEPPLYYWTPSIAPCGMDFVQGNRYPGWEGRLLVGALKFGYVELLTLDGKKVTDRQKLAEGIGRLRNVKMGPDDYIYFAVEGQGIYRLVPK